MNKPPLPYTPRELYEQMLAASAAFTTLVRAGELEAAEEKCSELAALRREYAATLGI